MRIPDFAQLYKKYQHLITVQNAGLAVAVIIAFVWVWGAVATLQQNYQHQRRVDANSQQIELMKLQNQNFEYMQAYYRSDEFLELSAREKLGKAFPGEKLVILPSSDHIKDTQSSTAAVSGITEEESNFSKWMDFFFGGNQTKT